MRDAWFCYQETSKGYTPVIIYDNDPADKGLETYLKPKILQSHKLTDDLFEYDEVNVSFNILSKIYPYEG